MKFAEYDLVDFLQGPTCNYHSVPGIVNWLGYDDLEIGQFVNGSHCVVEEFSDEHICESI